MVDLDNDKLPNIVSGNTPKNYELCQEGDIAFADASEDTNEVAKAVEFYNLNDKDVICGLHTIHGRDNQHKTIVGYKGYAFSSTAFHQQIRRIAQGTKIYSINSKNFSECYIGIPSKGEQKKIATLLRLIDERISTQNKIIEDLKKLKCAIIEKHYRQAKLHKYKICDLGVPFSVGSLSKEDLSEKGHECILYGELFTTYDCVINEIKSHTNKIANMTLSQKRDLLFPSSTTVDAVSLISPSVIDIPNVVLGGDMFGIHIDKKFNAYYLSYYINIITRKKLAIYAKGSTIIHLHYKDIAKAQLLLPDLCEQDRIAKCMMAEDEKIKVEEQLMTKLEEQKQYLLRQMFI